MQKLTEFLTKQKEPILNVSKIVLVLAALIFIFVLGLKAMKAFSGGNVGEGAKFIGYALLVALIAYMGVKGVVTLFDSIAPEADIISGDKFSMSGLSPHITELTSRLGML